LTIPFPKWRGATIGRGGRYRRTPVGAGLFAVLIAALFGAATVCSCAPNGFGTAPGELTGSNGPATLGVPFPGDGTAGWPTIAAANGIAALAMESEPTEPDTLAAGTWKSALFRLSPMACQFWPAFLPERRSTPLYLRHRSLLC